MGELSGSGQAGRQRGGELTAATAAPAVTHRLAEAMSGYARAARAGNTWRAYEADLRHFAAWCEHHRLAPLSAAPATAADMTVGRT